MSAPLHSAPAKALDLILHGPSSITNPHIRLLDYRSPSTFSSLWLHGLESGKATIDGQVIDLADPGKLFLLIGNDPPESALDATHPSLRGLNLRGHFTAASWLAAWRLRFPDSPARIAVIDPREAALASGPARALQAILAARDASDRPLVPGAAVLNAPSLEAICRWLSDADDRIDPKVAPPSLDLLRATLWNELSSDRERHHALSNALGALLLSSQVGRGTVHGGEPWAQDYLLALVRAIGIGAEQAMVPLEDGRRNWISASLGRRLGGALLLDDMGDLWEYFLRGALGFVGEAPFAKTGRSFRESFERFGGSDFPGAIAALPQRLEDFITTGRSRLEASDLLGTTSRLGEDFVLFLDLRLFPGAGDAAARTFYAALARCGKRLLGSGHRLAWLDGAGRAALLAELDAWLEGEETEASASPKSGAEGTAAVADGEGGVPLPPPETLLARLLSLIDPTLPIVLFTSTGRSELIDPFRDYGNIVTSFRKPTMTGMDGRRWAEAVAELRVDLREALERAADILRARSMLRPQAVAPTPRSGGTGPSGRAAAVEIFIDESILTDFQTTRSDGRSETKSVMAVGAAVCVAESSEAVARFCSALEEKGLHWGLSASNRDLHVEESRHPWADGATRRLECRRGWRLKQAPEDFRHFPKKPKTGEIAAAAAAIHETAGECGVELFAACLTCDPYRSDTLQGRAGLGWDPVSADEAHKELTRRLLQTLLVADPRVAGALESESCTLSLDLGDRIHELNGGREECEQLFQTYGIRYVDQGLAGLTPEEESDLRERHPNNRSLPAWAPTAKAISVASDHALFALREALASLPKRPGRLTIDRCRGAALMDFGDRRSWPYRLNLFPAFPFQIHYLADWISRQGAYASLWGPEQWEALGPVAQQGWLLPWSNRSGELLDWTLAGLSGRRPEALAAVQAWSARFRNPYDAEALLVRRAESLGGELEGAELRKLFELAALSRTNAA